MSGESITLGLTWAYSMELLIAALESGTPEGKRLAREELRDLAKRLDAMNKENDHATPPA